MPQLGEQFDQVGPLHARIAHDESMGMPNEGHHDMVASGYHAHPSITRRVQAGLEPAHHEQGELFSRASVPYPEPHTQTSEQFAKDPRTWWHGRYANRLTKGGTDEGFHVGSQGAAQGRLEKNYGRQSGNKEAHMFPLRINPEAKFSNTPAEPGPDVNKHSYLGGNSSMRNPGPPGYKSGTGQFYENVVEGGAGEISVGVPKREGFLSTYGEHVKAAKAAGKDIHPNVAWSAKKNPEHTGVDAVAGKRLGAWGAEKKPTTAPIPTAGNDDAHEVWNPTLADRSHGGPIARTSYETEGGRMKHVWRDRRQGGGSDREPRNWQPT